MHIEVYDEKNTLVQLVMVLKLQQLLSCGIPALRYENLEDYLHKSLWKERCPFSLHEATNEVLNIKPNEIVRFMAQEALRNASNQELYQFSEHFGGNK